jgi:hypothetical protein
MLLLLLLDYFFRFLSFSSSSSFYIEYNIIGKCYYKYNNIKSFCDKRVLYL